MHTSKKFVYYIFLTIFPLSVWAAPPSSHQQIPKTSFPEAENGSWVFGCYLYNLLDTVQVVNYVAWRDSCWVDAPAPPVGVDEFGFSFNAAGQSHWGQQSPYPTGSSHPGSWSHTSSGIHEEFIEPLIYNYSTNLYLYWDQLTYNYYFWYKVPNDSTYYDAGLHGSINRSGHGRKVYP